MARGGKREGAGRKVNALTVRTRKIAEKAATEGVMPLEVMLGNMRFHYAEATDFMSKLIERAQEAGPIEPGELKDLLKFLHSSREKAEDCARDAAPYIHPRLASVTHAGDKDEPIQIAITRRIVGD